MIMISKLEILWIRVVDAWNVLKVDAAEAESLNIFKNKINLYIFT